MPERIQRKRTKGWRMPEGAVYVGRPTRWGNPYTVRAVDRYGQYPFGWRVVPEPSVARVGHFYRTEIEAIERALDLFRREVTRPSWDERVTALRGRDLVCWCPLDQPCHADVLLDIANPTDTGGQP